MIYEDCDNFRIEVIKVFFSLREISTKRIRFDVIIKHGHRKNKEIEKNQDLLYLSLIPSIGGTIKEQKHYYTLYNKLIAKRKFFYCSKITTLVIKSTDWYNKKQTIPELNKYLLPSKIF